MHRVHRSFWIWLLACCSLLGVGCDTTPPPAPVTKTVVVDIPKEPSEIELTDAKAVFKSTELVQFEVKYRFKKGKPLKYYLCEIKFPNTTHQGIKYMDGWELKESGVIRDGVIIQSAPVTTFEIKMSEANHPEQGYDLISNVVTGEVEQLGAKKQSDEKNGKQGSDEKGDLP
jgi:hypothetical protein